MSYLLDDTYDDDTYDTFLADACARLSDAPIADVLDGLDMGWLGPADLHLDLDPAYLDDRQGQRVTAAYGGGAPLRGPFVAVSAAPGDDPPGDEDSDGVPREGGGRGGREPISYRTLYARASTLYGGWPP